MRAVVRSEIGESDIDDLVIEAFVVELVDDNLPYPHIGGFRGLRSVATNLIIDDWVEFYDWNYEAENVFEGILPSGKVKWVQELSTLSKYAKAEYDMIAAGERFASFSKYFDNQNVPYAENECSFKLDKKEEIQEFTRMLNRKFGLEKQVEIQKCFNGILKDLERPPMFLSYPSRKKEEPTVNPSYETWGLFS